MAMDVKPKTKKPAPKRSGTSIARGTTQFVRDGVLDHKTQSFDPSVNEPLCRSITEPPGTTRAAPSLEVYFLTLTWPIRTFHRLSDHALNEVPSTHSRMITQCGWTPALQGRLPQSSTKYPNNANARRCAFTLAGLISHVKGQR